MTHGLYGHDEDGRPIWDDCPGCGYAPGRGDDGLCSSCAAELEKALADAKRAVVDECERRGIELVVNGERIV